ncbi:MAG: DUF4364 family protein [Oscillospiraceae bacterium]|nr:DUF4364 family protein [Oscillospiraceae bacterium]
MDRHGFVRSELELKTLILYALSRTDLAIPFSELTDLVLVDGAIGYFEYASALSDLAVSGHVVCAGTESSEEYSISPQGKAVLETCVSTLAPSVRRRVDEALEALLPRLQRYHLIDTSVVIKDENRMSAICRLKDDIGEVFSFELTVPDKDQAAEVVNRFRANAEGIYKKFLDYLLGLDES